LMPEMGGFEMLERLRQDPQTAEIPVVISTSKVLDDQERQRIEQLSAGFLSKSKLTDGTAAAELRRICGAMGLAGIPPEPVAGGAAL